MVRGVRHADELVSSEHAASSRGEVDDLMNARRNSAYNNVLYSVYFEFDSLDPCATDAAIAGELRGGLMALGLLNL